MKTKLWLEVFLGEQDWLLTKKCKLNFIPPPGLELVIGGWLSDPFIVKHCSFDLGEGLLNVFLQEVSVGCEKDKLQSFFELKLCGFTIHGTDEENALFESLRPPEGKYLIEEPAHV